MSTPIEHLDIPLEERHAPHNWEYADATEREAATDFVPEDVGRQALQLDDFSRWTLIDDDPATWQSDADGGAPGGSAGGALSGTYPNPSVKTVICIACSDESTALAAATAVVTFRMPHAMTLTEVRASLTGAAGSGTFTVDINEGGSTILSTKLTIDATEKTSTTAATPAVISDANLADDAEITIDIDDDAAGDAVGLKVYLIGTRS